MDDPFVLSSQVMSAFFLESSIDIEFQTKNGSEVNSTTT